MTTTALLVFDLGNVLLDLDFERFVVGAARESGRDATSIRDRYIAGERKRELERGRTTGERFLDEMADWLAWPPGGRERLRHLWCDVFDPVPAAESLIPRLAQRHRLWLLSDTNDLHWTYLEREFPLLRQFARSFLSFQRGVLKSDPGAFAALLAEAGCAGERILFFDDLADNVAAARRAGLNAQVFTSWQDAARTLQDLG